MSFTVTEIAQQPKIWRAVEEVVETSGVRDFLAPLLAVPNLRIVLTGAGTSAYIGQVLAPSLTRVLARRVDAIPTTDIVANPYAILAEDVPTLVVSFARSGDSPESLAAVALTHRHQHLVVTCNPDGALAQGQSEFALLMPEGTNDRGFAMTSSFTSMLLAAWLAFTPPSPGLVERLATAGESRLQENRATELAARGYSRVVYLGSGALTGLARESSLKLTELTAGSVVSWAESALGFRHGPKAVLRPGTLAVVYFSHDPHTRLYDQDIAAELRADLGAENVLVLESEFDDACAAVVLVILAQQIALSFSQRLGLDPDNPFPDGQVNRVVQGVTVHALEA